MGVSIVDTCCPAKVLEPGPLEYTNLAVLRMSSRPIFWYSVARQGWAHVGWQNWLSVANYIVKTVDGVAMAT